MARRTDRSILLHLSEQESHRLRELLHLAPQMRVPSRSRMPKRLAIAAALLGSLGLLGFALWL